MPKRERKAVNRKRNSSSASNKGSSLRKPNAVVVSAEERARKLSIASRKRLEQLENDNTFADVDRTDLEEDELPLTGYTEEGGKWIVRSFFTVCGYFQFPFFLNIFQKKSN